MTTLSRKHFNLYAKLISLLPATLRHDAIAECTTVFEKENKHFDPVTFAQSCKGEETSKPQVTPGIEKTVKISVNTTAWGEQFSHSKQTIPIFSIHYRKYDRVESFDSVIDWAFDFEHEEGGFDVDHKGQVTQYVHPKGELRPSMRSFLAYIFNVEFVSGSLDYSHNSEYTIANFLNDLLTNVSTPTEDIETEDIYGSFVTFEVKPEHLPALLEEIKQIYELTSRFQFVTKKQAEKDFDQLCCDIAKKHGLEFEPEGCHERVLFDLIHGQQPGDQEWKDETHKTRLEKAKAEIQALEDYEEFEDFL